MPPRAFPPATAFTATEEQVSAVWAIFVSHGGKRLSRSEVRSRVEDQLFFAALFGRKVRYEYPRAQAGEGRAA